MFQSTGSRIRLPGSQCQTYHSFISCVALEVISSCLSFFTCKVGKIQCLPGGYFEYEMNEGRYNDYNSAWHVEVQLMLIVVISSGSRFVIIILPVLVKIVLISLSSSRVREFGYLSS